MVLSCYLCGSEWVFTSFHCDKCIEISRIVKLIGRDRCLSILKNKCFKLVDFKLSPIQEEEQTDDIMHPAPIPAPANITNKSYADCLKELNQKLEYKKK